MRKQEIFVSTDNVVFYKNQNEFKVLLIKRKGDPFKGKWALPGGFLEENESMDEGAKRELKEETGLEIEELHQIKAFGDLGRDPRGRTISIAFWGIISTQENVKANDDASAASWFPLNQLPELAFDHQEIIDQAVILYKLEND